MVGTDNHLSYRVRLQRARTSATLRYHRRKTESLRLWHLHIAKWGNHPGLSWTAYENALHLEDQAYMLLTRVTIMTKHA